jgi:hypothetical protein
VPEVRDLLRRRILSSIIAVQGQLESEPAEAIAPT